MTLFLYFVSLLNHHNYKINLVIIKLIIRREPSISPRYCEYFLNGYCIYYLTNLHPHRPAPRCIIMKISAFRRKGAAVWSFGGAGGCSATGWRRRLLLFGASPSYRRSICWAGLSRGRSCFTASPSLMRFLLRSARGRCLARGCARSCASPRRGCSA